MDDPARALRDYDFEFMLNGKKTGTVKSGPLGKVQIGKLSAKLLTVRSVQLIAPSGKTAATLKF